MDAKKKPSIKKIHDAQGGAKNSNPPRRVLRTSKL